MPDIKEMDISHEDWREYDFGGRTYKIILPLKLYYREGGTTHRIVTKDAHDNLIAHCVPAPGVNGCVLRWYTPPSKGGPVNF